MGSSECVIENNKLKGSQLALTCCVRQHNRQFRQKSPPVTEHVKHTSIVDKFERRGREEKGAKGTTMYNYR